MNLHRAINTGDLTTVAELLKQPSVYAEINTLDRNGLTPLMLAARNRNANPEILLLLLEHGADINMKSKPVHAAPAPKTALTLALAAGDPEKVALLLARGADPHYLRANGYNAALDAVYGRDITRDTRLIDLLTLLIKHKVNLNAVSEYGESALRVLSRLGRFDAVSHLLAAGADHGQLGFSKLHDAVALGSLQALKECLATAPDIEARDWWSRTPLLMAIHAGDITKAECLAKAGADITARGRCGKPSTFYAVESGNLRMLKWALEFGASLHAKDEFGGNALLLATQSNDLEACEFLLTKGADCNIEVHGQTPLGAARSRKLILRLLEAGADKRKLTDESRRILLGLPPSPNEELLSVSAKQFQQGRQRYFGKSNPEQVSEPFWLGMIRAGISGFQASKIFESAIARSTQPVWCAQRFGQSVTILPDGRIVLVGGEHEDYYDPDFCIYNDVFVCQPGETVEIYAYPESVFPPTDFHSATLKEDVIYLIGSLGYHGSRSFGTTPVYRLHTTDWRMEKVATCGEAPGWLHDHQAELLDSGDIMVWDGIVAELESGNESLRENSGTFILETATGRWRRKE
jgi:ankyrin repeat protein